MCCNLVIDWACSIHSFIAKFLCSSHCLDMSCKIPFYWSSYHNSTAKTLSGTTKKCTVHRPVLPQRNETGQWVLRRPRIGSLGTRLDTRKRTRVMKATSMSNIGENLEPCRRTKKAHNCESLRYIYNWHIGLGPVQSISLGRVFDNRGLPTVAHKRHDNSDAAH